MKHVHLAIAAALALLPAVARADKDINQTGTPDKTAAFSSWTAVDQWMPDGGGGSDPRTKYGYGTLSGMLVLADELGDSFGELGRASLIEKCFHNTEEKTSASLIWALCGNDVKALDLAKLETELSSGGISATSRAAVVEDAKQTLEHAQKVGAAVETAAKDDPGLASFLKTADVAKAEWAAYLAKHKADFDRYLALKDAVRSNKSNNKGFEGCYEATQPAFAKLVKSVHLTPTNGDPMPGFVAQLVGTTEGYITTVAYAACAWSVSTAGEALYVAAANQLGGHARAGWRSIALAKMLDPSFKPKFADRSLGLSNMTFEWKYGIKMAGVNDNASIETPRQGTVAQLKPNGDTTGISFKGNTVESCLQWEETNKVAQVTGSSVSYEKVCKKRGMIPNQTTATEVPSKYLNGVKVGDEITIVHGFPVVAWKGTKNTSVLGVSLR